MSPPSALVEPVMTAEIPLSSGGATARPVSIGDSTSSPNDIQNDKSATEDPEAAPADASSSGRSLKLQKVFSRSRNVSIDNNNNNGTRSKRGSLINSLSSFRRSTKSELSDDSDDDQRDFHDLTPRPSLDGRRRSSLLMRRLSSISGRRGSNYSSHSSGVGGNDSSSGRLRSAVNRKSSLDLLKGSGGEYRPRSEHPLLTHAEEENKAPKRRSSFLGNAIRRLSSSGNLRALTAKSKSAHDIATAAASSPLTSSSDHGPQPRKGSFFRNLRRKSSRGEEQEDETLRHTYHG